MLAALPPVLLYAFRHVIDTLLPRQTAVVTYDIERRYVDYAVYVDVIYVTRRWRYADISYGVAARARYVLAERARYGYGEQEQALLLLPVVMLMFAATLIPGC